MSRYAAVIFDLDGTLIDTERLVMDAALSVLGSLGMNVGREFMAGLIGVEADEGMRRLQAHVGQDTDLGAFDRDWEIEIRAAYARGIPLMKGVDEVLDHIVARGLPRAVATNSVTGGARRKLGNAGILHHFAPDHVIGVDQVTHAKPAPDLFLTAATRLGVDPARCLVFEDSDAGVAGALAAGMTVVQIPDMQPPGTRDAHHLAETMIEGARAAGLIL